MFREDVDDRLGAVRLYFSTAGVGQVAHVAGELDNRDLHPVAQAEVGDAFRTHVLNGGDLAVYAPKAEPAGHDDAVETRQLCGGVAIREIGAIDPCEIDLGVQIEIDLSPVKPDSKTGLSTSHVAIGDIHYPPSSDEVETGKIIYVKTSLCSGDPTDLHEYKHLHPSFPHESTADQLFDEAQFESYRELGYRAGKQGALCLQEILSDGGKKPTTVGESETGSQTQARAHAGHTGER